VNIWFVHSSPAQLLGGGEMFSVRLASWLKARGHQVRLAARPGGRMESAARAVWHNVRPLAMRNDLDWWSRRTLRRWFGTDRPDVVFGAFGRDIKLLGPGARAAGARIFWLQGVPMSDGSRVQRRLDRHFVDGYIVPSQFMKEELVRRGGIDPLKIDVIHPALDLKSFESDQGVADYGDRFRIGQRIPMDATVSICPARMVEVKGQHVLLEAWSMVVQELPDAYLLFAGDGPRRKALAAQVARLGLESRVRFLGHLTDIRPALWVSDLMILPSLAEPFGIVVLESLASGLAVVASRVGGIPEQIEEGKSGLLVPPGDAGALAEAATRVLRDTELRLALVQRGRARAREFTADRCFPALETRIAAPGRTDTACA